MQNKLNNKGLSDIVSAVLLILIGIATVGIIGYAVLNVARAPSLSPEWNCLEMKTNQALKVESACYDADENEIIIKVKRTLDDKFVFDKLDFILDSDSGSISFGCGSENCLCKILDVGASKYYYLDSSKKFNKVILRVGGCGIDESKIRDC